VTSLTFRTATALEQRLGNDRTFTRKAEREALLIGGTAIAEWLEGRPRRLGGGARAAAPTARDRLVARLREVAANPSLDASLRQFPWGAGAVVARRGRRLSLVLLIERERGAGAELIELERSGGEWREVGRGDGVLVNLAAAIDIERAPHLRPKHSVSAEHWSLVEEGCRYLRLPDAAGEPTWQPVIAWLLRAPTDTAIHPTPE